MNCPRCGSSARQEVKDTRSGADGRINRRRRCPDCHHDFQTVEQFSGSALHVRKSDGRIVTFSPEAVRRSMVEAAVRKYDPDRIQELIDSVKADVYPLADDGSVSSEEIGEAVLRHFRQIDVVSQIRFALAHLGRCDRTDGRPGWVDVNDFRRWLVTQYPQLQYYRPPARLVEVVKRDNSYEAYDREKLVAGIRVAAKGRGSGEAVRELAEKVVDDVEVALGDQPLVTSGQIASEILESLRRRDQVAYLRFASTAKRFRSPEDYEAEATALAHVPQNRRVRA